MEVSLEDREYDDLIWFERLVDGWIITDFTDSKRQI